MVGSWAAYASSYLGRDGTVGGVSEHAPVGTRVVLVAQLEVVARRDLAHVGDALVEGVVGLHN